MYRLGIWTLYPRLDSRSSPGSISISALLLLELPSLVGNRYPANAAKLLTSAELA